MADYIKMGRMLKELRAAKGLTQAQLAKELLTSQDNISRLEKGKAFDCDIICGISKYFGVSADYLLVLSDVPSTDTTVKGICEYTGLSENAVNSLNSLHCSAEKNSLKIISSILESRECEEIADLINDCCEISLLKRYHQKIVSLILDDHDQTLDSMGITKNNYDELRRAAINNDFDVNNFKADERLVAIHANGIIRNDIGASIHTFLEGRISLSGEIDPCIFDEKNYDEPQMLNEYKIIRLLTDLIIKIKSDTENDKERFVLYSQDIYQEINQSIQFLNESLEYGIADHTPIEEAFEIAKKNQYNLMTAEYLTEYLKSFKAKYIDNIC